MLAIQSRSRWRIRSERRPRIAGAAALAWALAACDGASDQRLEANDFVSAGIHIGGGMCLDCFRHLTVEAPGVLVLEDVNGEEHFELEESDYQAVLEIALDEQFQRAVAAPPGPLCSVLSDVEVDIEVQWQEREPQQALLSNGCFARCDQPEHPFMALRALLFELRDEYLRCHPDTCRYPEHCSVFPMVPPFNRMLCQVCLDDCGIPVPEGSPTRGDPPPTLEQLETCFRAGQQ